ncbi:MAG: hypothetical protein V4739_19165 [Pseudomonadota bacterium]
MLEAAAYGVGLVALASALLWLVEALAGWLGGRTAWLIFLVVVPFLGGLAVACLTANELAWWQRLVIALVSPAGVILTLAACFAAFNPLGAVAVSGALLQSAWQKLRSLFI